MTDPKKVAGMLIHAYGPQRQLIKCAEELNELAIECLHMADGNHGKPQKMVEEMADVRFMFLQLSLIMDEELNGKFDEVMNEAYTYKVKRTKILLGKEDEEDD
jgi:NTP pyrophosphatase (non-canonical NTP hydrolase)